MNFLRKNSDCHPKFFRSQIPDERFPFFNQVQDTIVLNVGKFCQKIDLFLVMKSDENCNFIAVYRKESVVFLKKGNIF